MKTYTLNFTSSQGRVKRVIKGEFKGLPKAVDYARHVMSAMSFYMANGEELTYTIHHNGELVWEESYTK